jgi:hypothetical protein
MDYQSDVTPGQQPKIFSLHCIKLAFISDAANLIMSFITPDLQGNSVDQHFINSSMSLIIW